MSLPCFPINTGETKRQGGEEEKKCRAEREEREQKRGRGVRKKKKNRERKREEIKTRRKTKKKEEEQNRGGAATNTAATWNHRHLWPSLTTKASPGKPSTPLAFVSSLDMQDVRGARLCRRGEAGYCAHAP
jgi:hypothetical protein